MRSKLLILLILLLASSSALAIGDVVVGPFYGYGIPVANMWAKPGPLYGVQARASFLPFLAGGAYFNSGGYGDIELVYFPDEPFEFSRFLDGGEVTEYGLNLYLGKTSGTGWNYYAVGGIGSHKWERNHRQEDSKVAYSLGGGLEYVLPMSLSIEGRAMFEAVSAGYDSMWKSVVAYVGMNYHFKFGPR
ncbi:MAG: hypothetical protein GY839_04455 [candidate division Zixibacteria bacterium]|nr:hypothetical protein [candidate division Zixibacteria bacterium]